jgi:hypothetical protein
LEDIKERVQGFKGSRVQGFKGPGIKLKIKNSASTNLGETGKK